jgi:hypothetical protein
MLALKPYWGKPTVRNFREDDENVGIIRSPNPAIVLLDRILTPSLSRLRERVRERVSPAKGAKDAKLRIVEKEFSLRA